MPPDDPDLTFYLQVYRDHDQAAWCLSRLRRSYPTARVVVLSDGDPDPRFPALAEAHGAEFFAGDRLYPVRHGGRMIHRMLEVFLHRPTRWLIKIDTDTSVERRLASAPPAGDVLGTVLVTAPFPCVQGGCTAFASEAAERLHASDALLDPALVNPRATWAVYREPRDRAERLGLIAYEWVTCYAAHRIGLTVRPWPEVLSRWKQTPENPVRRYAIIHPKKLSAPAPRAAAPGRVSGAGRPRVLYASYHSHHDPTDEGACWALALLDALTARGWQCGAFTGPGFGAEGTEPVGLALRGRPEVATTRGAAGGVRFSLLTARGPAGYPATTFAPDPPAAARPPSAAEADAFVAVMGDVLRRFRPHVVLTSGRDPASRVAAAAARRAGARVAFWQADPSDPGNGELPECDATVVPSAFCRDRRAVPNGVRCAILPPVLGSGPARAEGRDDTWFVTFVDPVPEKGALWFARIAEALGRVRPDVAVQVVEVRGRDGGPGRGGIDLSGVPVCRLAGARDLGPVLDRSRVVVVPSAAPESFSRVAAEAVLRGVPVVASDRGALPEVVGTGGTCLPLPEWFTPAASAPPSDAEIEPWVAAVLRLWDAPVAHADAAHAAGRWHPDAVVPRWETFLSALAGPR